MKSYDELKAEMEAIQQQMVEAKKNEIARIFYGLKRLCVSFGFTVVLFSLGACSPADPFSEIKSEEQLSQLIIELKENADLDNVAIGECANSCEGKSVFAELVEPVISSTRFDGDAEKSKTLKADGIEFKPINAEINDEGISIDLGFEKVNLNKNEFKAASFEISGEFVENHYVNDDVKGRIVSVSINEEKLKILIAKQIKIDEHKALVERDQMEAKLKREKVAGLLNNLSDGEHKYYGVNHRDNTISATEAEAICSMPLSISRQALVTNTLSASQAIRHIANNGGSVTKSRIFWAEDLKECLVPYKVSGLYNGTSYSTDLVGKAAVFVKRASSYSVKYIQ